MLRSGRYHVVEGAVLFSPDLVDGRVLKTSLGETLKVAVRDGVVYINDAQVVVEDVITAAGVVHVIDSYAHPLPLWTR